MADLPDYYTQTAISEAEAASFDGGLDANKSATPVSRDIYLATDTHILYVCFTDGTWTGFDAATLTQGILTLYANLAGGGFEIENIADPTAAQSAATRAYVLARAALYLPLAGGTMTGPVAMGASQITGLADPTLAQDAATRAYVLATSGLYLPLTGGTLTGDLVIGANKIKTTSLLLKEFDADQFALRNLADTAYKALRLLTLNFQGNLKSIANATRIQAAVGANNYLAFDAKDTAGALADVARLQGAAVAYWQMTRPFVMSPYAGALLAIEGAMGYDGDDDKVHYYDAAGEKILAREDLYIANALLTAQGDIITRNATIPKRLALGTAGYVLTAGASEPAWAAPIVPTKEFFVPFLAGTGGLNIIGSYARYGLTVGLWGALSFKVPADFSSLTSCKLAVIHSVSEDIDWTVDTQFAADGEAYNTHSDSVTEDGRTMVANQIDEIDISAAFTGLAAGDLVGVKATLDTAAAGVLHMLGIMFKYS